MNQYLTGRARGFTLIEIMVVVAIVAILTSSGLVAYQSYVKRAKVVEGTTFLASRKAAISEYYNHYHTMPVYLEDLGWDSKTAPRKEGKINTYTSITGKANDIWTSVGLVSNPTPNARNIWRTQYINLYLQADPSALSEASSKRHFFLEAKATMGQVQFRCSVNNAELLPLVPANCRVLHPATPNLVQW